MAPEKTGINDLRYRKSLDFDSDYSGHFRGFQEACHPHRLRNVVYVFNYAFSDLKDSPFQPLTLDQRGAWIGE